jgi:hypothetical protein
MRLTTLQKNETSVSALAERIYPNLSDSARKKVEAALAKANPQLTKPGAFRPGVVVNLPDDVKPKPGSASADPVADALSGLQDAVTAYHEGLVEGIKASIADMAAQEKILKQKEVAAAIKADAAASELAKSLTASLRQREKLAEQEIKDHEATFAQIAKDIGSLLG